MWTRRLHRWLGVAAVFFVMLLSITGVALNHSSDWGLDRHYVDWDWAMASLGLRVPTHSVSFADRGHRVTQLGERAYFDASEIDHAVESLTGLVVLEPFAVIATADAILLVTVDGTLVQRLDVSAELPVPVRRVGRIDARPVLESDGSYFIGDVDVTAFAPWVDADRSAVTWSVASSPSRSEFESIQDLYRSRSLTLERLLLEIHSGRIIAGAGPLLLDLVAGGLVLLSVSGVGVWLWGGSRRNGPRGPASRMRD